MARAHGEIRFLRKKEKKNRTSKSVSKKDEKAPGISENHVISADNKEKSEVFNSFYSHLQGE